MRLAELVDILADKAVNGRTDLEVTGITYDSRRVSPGHVFVAVRGRHHDGHDFIPEAVSRGARAVVTEREVPPPGVTVLRVPETRYAMGLLASRFYGHPSGKVRVIGVTGTNGKTTTTYLIRSILREAGHTVGLIGTVSYQIGDIEYPVERTTPEAPDLQALLARMVEAGISHVVMEVSSHALSLHRVVGCDFDIGVFTNLTRDHLDFHSDMEAYGEAKAKLFAGLGQTFAGPVKGGGKGAVVNADDEWGARMLAATAVPGVTYGIEKKADVRASQLAIEPAGVSFLTVVSGGEVPVRLSLTGRFNVYNALAAIGVAVLEGIPVEVAARGLEKVRCVPGRLQVVEGGNGFAVLVDYAHTPDGLENVLRAARELATGRVIVVFGCGGDRDRGKRPRMGNIAARLADYTVITSDNPRTEEPEAIIREIEEGYLAAGKGRESYRVDVDRREAITRAVLMAGPGDVVLIAGKGHETYQIFKDRTVPFDDREEARRALAERRVAEERTAQERG